MDEKQIKVDSKSKKLKYTHIPNDMSIKFYEDSHTYHIKGENCEFAKRVPLSVSETSKRFFTPFNVIEVAKNIHRKYKKSPYWSNDINVIIQKLQRKGNESRKLGTGFHKVPELYYLNGETFDGITYNPKLNQEVKQFKKYLKYWNLCRKDLVCVGVEVRVVLWPIAGTIDKLEKKSDGSLVITDWKRAKNFSSGLHFAKYTSKFPFIYKKDCALNKYFYQQNMYRFLIEKNGLKVSEMYLVRFYENEDFEIIKVPDWRKEIGMCYDSIIYADDY